jgi:hypothetical protein
MPGFIEGTELSQAQHRGQADPDFKAEDCTDKTMITGTDGVMVSIMTMINETNWRTYENTSANAWQ